MIKKILNTKFKKDLLFSYITQAITVSFGFIQLFLINKYFGVETYGQLAIIISTAGIFSSLLTARSSEAVTRFFKREELNKNFENAKFVLLIGFTIDFITAILLVALIYLFSNFIATIFLKNLNLSDEIIIYSFITFFLFLRGTLIGYLQSKEMFVKINIISIVESLFKVFGLLIAIYFFKFSSLKAVIYVFFFASLVSFLFAIFIFLKSYFREYFTVKIIINKSLLKEYWSFNIKTFFSSSLKAGNQNIDNLIIGYFLNAEVVGIYQILKKVLSPIMIIATPFSTLVYPRLINYFETNQKEKFKNIIIKISVYILFISMTYVLISYIFLSYIFRLMNIEFYDIYNNYFLLVAILYILTSQMWWVRAFSNTVNPNYSIYMNLFATIFQLTVTILLSNYFGFIGMLISIVFMNIIILSFWFRKGYKYVYTYIHT
jgi:O-antigen/teichoic acid export membrane protein